MVEIDLGVEMIGIDSGGVAGAVWALSIRSPIITLFIVCMAPGISSCRKQYELIE